MDTLQRRVRQISFEEIGVGEANNLFFSLLPPKICICEVTALEIHLRERRRIPQTIGEHLWTGPVLDSRNRPAMTATASFA